jgi:hypothetical protein
VNKRVVLVCRRVGPGYQLKSDAVESVGDGVAGTTFHGGMYTAHVSAKQTT